MSRALWCMRYVGCCPVCGRDKSYSEARYTQPPPKQERYRAIPDTQTYDWCDA